MTLNLLDEVYEPVEETQPEETTDTCTIVPTENAQGSNSGMLSTILLIAGALLLCLAIALIYKKRKK